MEGKTFLDSLKQQTVTHHVSLARQSRTEPFHTAHHSTGHRQSWPNSRYCSSYVYPVRSPHILCTGGNNLDVVGGTPVSGRSRHERLSCSISSWRLCIVQNKILGQRRRRDVTSLGTSQLVRHSGVALRSVMTMS